MSQASQPARESWRAGSGTLRSPIIACVTQDCGAAIMCDTCGHIFAESVPLTDQSEPVDNVTLAKAIYYHQCALGRRPDAVKNHR